MRKGDKTIGLRQLQHAIEHSTYLKVEALMFMSFIQLKYELNMESALKYAARLHNAYPENIYYRSHYIIVLLHHGDFSMAESLLNDIPANRDTFSLMLISLCEGFLQEQKYGSYVRARSYYLKGLEMAEKLGDFGDLYKAIAYMGLSRISGSENDEPMEKKYRRKAKSLTNYPFILSETGSGPR